MFKKILIIFTLILSIGLLSSSYIIYNFYGKIDKDNKEDIITNNNDKNNYETKDSNETDNISNSNQEIKNIALLGIDSSEDNPGRSDCIMIITLDEINKEIKISSIIRDSFVDIPTQNKKDKINHAYAFGGPKLTLSTINTNFNLDVTDYVSVNFSTLPKLIDKVNGIDIDITDDELNYINNYIDNINSINNTNSPHITCSGTQTLDGTQTLAYTRIRYTAGGDFERSHRQRLVFEKLVDKLKNISPFEYPELLNEFLPLVKTNLTADDLMHLSLNLGSLKDYQLSEERFPEDDDGNGQLINGIYYYVFDIEDTKNKIHKYIYDQQ